MHKAISERMLPVSGHEHSFRCTARLLVITGLFILLVSIVISCSQPDNGRPPPPSATSTSNATIIQAPTSTLASSTENTGDPAASPTASFVFPTQLPLSAQAAAELSGKLVDKGRCLYVIADHSNTDYPIIWPHGYSWSDEDGVIQVIDESGQVVAQVGDSIVMGGGEGPSSGVGCVGPAYVWYAAGPVRTAERAAIPTPTPPPPDIPFPRTETPSGGAAELVGILTNSDGCLRVDAGEGDASYLVIWPPGIAPRGDIGSVVLDDGSNLQVGSMGVQHYRGWIGAELYLAGEPVDSLPDTLPIEGSTGSCPGPYWISGPDVRVAEFVSIDGQPPRLDPNDGTLAGVIQYATDYELTLAEANRRLLLQDAIGMLNATLQANEPEVFDVLYVTHEPEYRVIIKVKPDNPDAEAIIQEYIAGGPLEGMVDIRVSTWTEEDLSTHQTEATRILEELGIHHTSMTDVRTERVEIMVVDLAEAESAIQEAGVSLPETVVFIEFAP